MRPADADRLSSMLRLQGKRFLRFSAEEPSAYFPAFSERAQPLKLSLSRHGRLPLPDDSVDRMLAAGAFSRLEAKPAFLAEARRLLSPGGGLCLLEEEGGCRMEEAVEALRAAGFSAVVCHQEFAGWWCLTAVKGMFEA